MAEQLTPEELAAFEAAPALTEDELAAFEAAPAIPEAEPIEALGVAEALARGAAEGATFGFSGEIAGRVAQLEELGKRLAGAPPREMVNAYLRGKREADVALEAARKAQPVAAYGAELLSGALVPIPGAGAVRSAAQAGRMGAAALRGAAVGAGAGAVSALGRTEAPTAAGVAKEVATEAALGGAMGGVLAPVAARVVSGRAKAQQEALELIRQKREKAANVARSALGGETSTGARTLEQATAAIADPNVDPQIKADAVAFLNSPEGIALRNQVLASSIERGKGQLGRIAVAEQVRQEAAKAATAPEVAKGTAEYLAEGLTPEVYPRAMRYASRVVPVAIASGLGGMVGGTTGAVLGSAVGGVVAGSMGAPGTALYNMLKSPRFRYGAAGYAMPALEAAAARGPTALAATYYLLANKDPEVRAAAEAAQKEAQESPVTAAP